MTGSRPSLCSALMTAWFLDCVHEFLLGPFPLHELPLPRVHCINIIAVPVSSGSTDVSPSTDDFDDIFGNAPPGAAEALLPSSKEQTGGKSDRVGADSTG